MSFFKLCTENLYYPISFPAGEAIVHIFHLRTPGVRDEAAEPAGLPSQWTVKPRLGSDWQSSSLPWLLLAIVLEGRLLTDTVDIRGRGFLSLQEKVILDAALGGGLSVAKGGGLLPCPGGEGQAAGSQAKTEGEWGGGVLAKDPRAGRQPWTPFQGRTRVSKASGPRGSGLELKEPNFP